jgi:HAD superfamily hydrolase (TIGR01484 family)
MSVSFAPCFRLAGIRDMQALEAADAATLQAVRYVLCDLDDTVTLDGRLPAGSYGALERLSQSGRDVVVVTGRPAGWCDLIARWWPVAGVIGENGALYFAYDHAAQRMTRVYSRADAERQADQARMRALFGDVQARFPDARLAADQPYRISDIAIDICEDVTPLPAADVAAIVDLLQNAGATVKVSSIHINAWIGDFTKREMVQRFFQEHLGVDATGILDRIIYVGDSPNDEPMFEAFELTVGVANLAAYADQMQHLPRWITKGRGGNGFEELAAVILGI